MIIQPTSNDNELLHPTGRNVASFFVNVFVTFETVAKAMLDRTAVFFVPLALAVTFGYELAGSLTDTISNDWVRGLVGGAAAYGLEAAGFKSFIVAQRRGDWWWGLPLTYFVSAGVTILTMEYFGIEAILVFFLVLSSLSYIANAGTLAVQSELAEAQDVAVYQRQQDAINAERAHQIRLAEVEARRDVKIAKAEASAGQVAGKLPESQHPLAERVRQLGASWGKVRNDTELVGELSALDDGTLRIVLLQAGVKGRTARNWRSYLKKALA